MVTNEEQTDHVVAGVLTLLNQLNQKHEHSLTKAQLVAGLEELLQ